MKANAQCPKCQSLKIGILENLWDSIGPEKDQKETIGRTRWGGPVFFTQVPRGEVEAYVCTECGYYETYVKDPSSVPFESMVGFRWINEPAPPEGPYR